VASRLHGVILSHVTCAPVLAISYDRKVNAYMESMKQSDRIISIESISGNGVIIEYEKLADDESAARDQLRQDRDTCSQLLTDHFDDLLRLTRVET
jgi:polysaccharide pyruvyl transferase WcaK-like protein